KFKRSTILLPRSGSTMNREVAAGKYCGTSTQRYHEAGGTNAKAEMSVTVGLQKSVKCDTV
ncbi:hypothetical protein J6590_065815, partial [Homalodisca vitripennis]